MNKEQKESIEKLMNLEFPTFTFTKKVKSYVMESSLRELCEAGVIQSYDLKQTSEGSEVTISVALEPTQPDENKPALPTIFGRTPITCQCKKEPLANEYYTAEICQTCGGTKLEKL